MLILTRRVGESLKIGQLEDILDGPVTVTVLGVKGRQVRIGVEAPESLRIDREEIRQRIDEEERKNNAGRERLTLARG